jgi:hypothetical protein
LEALGKFVDNWLKSEMPVVRPYEFEEWLETTSYSGVRKDELRGAYAKLRGGLPDKRTASKVNSFVKTQGFDTYKHARLIMSRGDGFKVFSGPAFKAIEDVLYQKRPFVKHVPVPDRPQLVESLIQAGRKYYATDFTAFESHFTPEVMATLEMKLYKHCLQGWSGYKRLEQVLLGINRLSLRSGVRATCRARRMSGEMCTSLGNSFSNYILAKFIASRAGGEIEGFVEGDDGLFASTVPITAAAYERLGFTIKIVEVEDPRTASFCGMVFAEGGDILRDPRHFVANFSFTHSCIHGGNRVMRELLRAKALSTLYETPACPVVTAFARRALRDTRGATPRFVADGYHEHAAVPRDERGIKQRVITPASRDLFHRLYGVSVRVQLAVERAAEQGDWNKVAELMPAGENMQHYCDRYVELT